MNMSDSENLENQLWYRNPLNSPCATDFNTSNGLGITWNP